MSVFERYCNREEIMNKLQEQVAAQIHESRAAWMRDLAEEATPFQGRDGYGMLIPTRITQRWKRHMSTPYADLLDDEKVRVRQEAGRLLALVNASSDMP